MIGRKAMFVAALFQAASCRYADAEKCPNARQQHGANGEIKREILALLGLTRRPAAADVGDGQDARASAPRYMMGLYRTQYDDAVPDSIVSGNSLDYDNRPSTVGLNSTAPVRRAAPGANRSERKAPRQRHLRGAAVQPDGGERSLLQRSDLVMSFPAIVKLPDYSRGARKQSKWRRDYHFNLDDVTSNELLTAAKFRVYKEQGARSLNQTIRINLHIASFDLSGDNPTATTLVESRLIDSQQQGWLVFDLSSSLRAWFASRLPTAPHSPKQNTLSLVATSQTVSGRTVRPGRVQLVGRRSHPSKQAFLVAFFQQNSNANSLLYERSLRRKRDSPRTAKRGDNATPVAGTTTPPEFDVETHMSPVTIDPSEEQYGDEELEDWDDEDDERVISRRRVKLKKKKKKGRNRKRNKSRKKRRRICQREALDVNFADLGWEDWIIAPSTYAAYRCSGECVFPLNAHMNATNHAIIQSLVNLVVQPAAYRLPEPCCSPTALDAMSVLYFNDNKNVVYKKYHSMVVLSCGCH